MKTNDERLKLPFDVDEDMLHDIASTIGVKIDIMGDVIVIEGDPAEVDEAAAKIAELPKRLPDDDDMKNVDPYQSQEVGQRYSDKTGHLPDEYSVYDLIAFNEDKGMWQCKKTTYHFTHAPYQHAYTSYDTVFMRPSQLAKMTKVNRRK